jgi:hypothetical protein
MGLKEHHYWQVRDAALRALATLVKRGVVEDRCAMISEISRFILTMTDFRSHFTIKEAYRDLLELCRDEEGNGSREKSGTKR